MRFITIPQRSSFYISNNKASIGNLGIRGRIQQISVKPVALADCEVTMPSCLNSLLPLYEIYAGKVLWLGFFLMNKHYFSTVLSSLRRENWRISLWMRINITYEYIESLSACDFCPIRARLASYNIERITNCRHLFTAFVCSNIKTIVKLPNRTFQHKDHDAKPAWSHVLITYTLNNKWTVKSLKTLCRVTDIRSILIL